MRRDRLSYEKIMMLMMMIMATLFFMPVVGLYLICKKESSPIIRAVGAVFLVAGVIIMIHTGGALG